MSATTDLQLGGAKLRTSVTPAAKEKRARARKIGTKARVASATKAGRATKSALPRGKAASKKSGRAMAQLSAAIIVGTTADNKLTELASDNGAVGSGTRNGARSSNGGGHPVKAHTEAGKKRLVNRLLGLAETQATEGGFKITPADLIRLMQLHKELNPQKDRKVTVQWVEDRPE